MNDSILVVDDSPSEIQPLLEALAVCGLSKHVVYKERIRAAKEWLENNRGLPAVAVSDLATEESPNDGAHLLEGLYKAATNSGGGLWAFLLSKLDDSLDEIAAGMHIPSLQLLRKNSPGWAESCAAKLKALYQHQLPSDSQNLERPSEALSGPARDVPPKDRIFVFANGRSEFRPLVDDCPLLELPANIQEEDEGNAPVFLYRGACITVDTNAKEWLVQSLVRWRMMAATPELELVVGDLTGAARRKDGSVDCEAIDTYEAAILRKPQVKIPYGPKIRSIHNIVGDARNHLSLRHLATHVFGRDHCMFPAVKNAYDSKRGECVPERKLPFPAELVRNSNEDGFFRRAHFILDEENAEVLNRWRRWFAWKHGRAVGV